MSNIRTAEKYHHNAFLCTPIPVILDDTVRLLEAIRERTGDIYYFNYARRPDLYIPRRQQYEGFSMSLYDEP